MPSQYGELQPTIVRDRLAGFGHPSKYQRGSRLGFATAATSLNGNQPNFARCLTVCWAGILHNIVSGVLPLTEFFARCKIHFTSKSCGLYWQRYCTALQQPASAKLCGVVQGMELRNFRRGRYLYSAGRPSRWASAHILVVYSLLICLVPCGRLNWLFVSCTRKYNVSHSIV